MRRILSLCLALVCLLGLVACNRPEQPEHHLFFYLVDETEIGSGATLFQSEERQVDSARPWKERIQMYLTGPVSDSLRNPFPRDLTVTSATLREAESVIEITLSEEYAQLTGIGLTLANTCLVWTLTEYANVERVELYCDNGADLMDGNRQLTRDLYRPNAEATEREYTCHLYFTDAEQRYLIPTVRKVVASENLPIYILYQLLEGPQEEGLVATMPKSTRLLEFRLENGIATVDFSDEFVSNRPRTALSERMTLYSIVNSLTELDDINGVRILVEGEKLDYYQYFRMPEVMVRSEAAIGPVRTGINEFDATLYYGSWSTEFLAAEPTRIIRDDTRSPGEMIVRTLLNSEPVNGLIQLMPEGVQLLSADTIEGVCYLDLSAEFANISGGHTAERRVVHALVASVCSIKDINAVMLTIEGGTVTLPHFDLSEPLSPQSSWFFPS